MNDDEYRAMRVYSRALARLANQDEAHDLIVWAAESFAKENAQLTDEIRLLADGTVREINEIWDQTRPIILLH